MDCSSPGFSGHGPSQAGILEWVAISSSRGSYRPRDWTRVSCIGGGFFTTMKAHESLLFSSNGAMKILSLLFCFMFLDCFSIFHLNIWWAFLWPHLVTSHFAPRLSPSYFYSGLQAWLTPAHLQGPRVCDLPWFHCSELHIPALGSLGGCDDCLCLLSPSFVVANTLCPQVHECLEGTGCVFLWGAWHRLGIMNVSWMNVQTPLDWPKMFEIVTESLLLLERVKWRWSVWSWCRADPWVCTMLMSPWCEGWFILICVHSPERGHLHRALNSCLVCWCFL